VHSNSPWIGSSSIKNVNVLKWFFARLQQQSATTINNQQPHKGWPRKGSRDHWKQFRDLKRCPSGLDCLIFEILFICELQPKLNKQSDSIRMKLFTYWLFHFLNRFYCFGVFYHSCRNFLVLFLCEYFGVLVSVSLAFL